MSGTNYERAVEALIAAALDEPPPMASYVVPQWSDGDPRWQVFDVKPTWWQMNFGQEVLEEAQRRLKGMRLRAFREMLDSGRITRPQLASALHVRMVDLDSYLEAP